MNHTYDYDRFYKIVIVGDSNVGKSNLLSKLSTNTFQTSYISTIGLDFGHYRLALDDQTIKLQVWDTAGQERFRTLTSAYYRGAHGFILVYDITDKISFDNLQSWLSEIKRNGCENGPTMIIGNKADLESERQVSKDEGQAFAKESKSQFYELSVKESTSVENVFKALTKEIMRRNIYPTQVESSSKLDAYGASSPATCPQCLIM